MPPKVSVVIPVFNGERYIEETLKSIFKQSYKDYEIIVVDDGSSDGTKAILNKYKDKIRCYFQENSGSPSRPRNVGIKNSISEYIALLDYDDLMLEDKLKKSIEVLENNKNISLIFTNFKFIVNGTLEKEGFLEEKQNKEIIGKIPYYKYQETVFSFKRPIYNELIRCNFIGTSTVVCRRKDLVELGLFDEDLRGIEDRDMWLRLSKAGKLFAYTNEILSYYRYLDNSISRQSNTFYSHIYFWRRFLNTEKDYENIKSVKRKLGKLHSSYGYAMRNQGMYLISFSHYLKSLYYSSLKEKIKAVFALIKIPFFVFLNIHKR